jgi:RnfABCDGE-type electron transport complex B subunit
MVRVACSVLSVGGLGLLFGLALAISAVLLKATVDENLASVEAALPGLDCGGCGYPGCAAYAAAIINEGAPVDRCRPGGPKTVSRITEILGMEAVGMPETRMVTQVHCCGGPMDTKTLGRYLGIKDCNALYALGAGSRACKEGCLGLGSCVRVCPVGAIGWDAHGRVWVDRENCIACGRCVDVCPTGAMRWVPYDADFVVACNSTASPRQVRGACDTGCIGCGICRKKSPDGGYMVQQSLCRIDYELHGDRTVGAEACPRHCIIPNVPRETCNPWSADGGLFPLSGLAEVRWNGDGRPARDKAIVAKPGQPDRTARKT